MQALAPFTPVREGTPGMEQPEKLRRLPPADRPSFDVARGTRHSSSLGPRLATGTGQISVAFHGGRVRRAGQGLFEGGSWEAGALSTSDVRCQLRRPALAVDERRGIPRHDTSDRRPSARRVVAAELVECDGGFRRAVGGVRDRQSPCRGTAADGASPRCGGVEEGFPSFQELSGANFLEGKVDLWTLHAPFFVALPLMEAFRASPHPR